MRKLMMPYRYGTQSFPLRRARSICRQKENIPMNILKGVAWYAMLILLITLVTLTLKNMGRTLERVSLTKIFKNCA
jgi:hypothetical protein